MRAYEEGTVRGAGVAEDHGLEGNGQLRWDRSFSFRFVT